jgi:hypothetical protein
MAYPDDITVDDDAIDAGTARSLKTISWLAAQLTPLLEEIRDNGISLNAYPSTFANFRLLTSAASTNKTSVKASGGSIASIQGRNNAATAVYLKLYDAVAAADVTVGTTAPVMTIRLPATSDFIFSYGSGAPVFDLGCVMALVAGLDDDNTDAVEVGDIEALNIGTF